jgi:hypothetical protein
MTPQTKTVIQEIQEYLHKYIVFADEMYSLPIALWIIATFMYLDFDAFAYLVITAATKRSGKTRLWELIQFCCSNPCPSGALTPAAIYKTMSEDRPTMGFDEAETLSSEAASTMRAILNMGYRKGSVVRRVIGNEVKEYEVYCPKVFILIGRAYDTLNDRSIIVQMKRGEPKERFVWERAKTEGAILREKIAALVEENRSAIIDCFQNFGRIDFLNDRDEEIWMPLFSLCKVLDKPSLKQLGMNAVDIATSKTQEATTYRNLMSADEEGKAQDDEYSRRLLMDMLAVCGKADYVRSAEALERLMALPLAPWRKYKGTGLEYNRIGMMLDRFGLQPGNQRVGKKVVKAYKRKDIERAIELHGIK